MTSESMRRKLLWTLTGGLLAALGCAHTYPAPQELVEARSAYTRAAVGPARTQDSARLRLAKEALDRAEIAYRNAGDEEKVRSEAYVALRRIQAAEAEADTALAAERRRKALGELATLEGIHAERARAELARQKERASKVEAQADIAKQEAAAQQARTAEERARAQAAQQQAALAQQEAERERKARADAEARAGQAMNELARVANVRREPRGVVVTLSGQVLFESDEASLLPASAASLDTVAAALKTLPKGSRPVVVEGHTDSRGPREYNLELSERRAQAVRDYLVSRGVPGDLFTVDALGPDRPVASNRTPEGRANNRRVEIVIPPPAPAAFAPSPPASAPGQPGDTTARPGLTPAPTLPPP